MTNLDLVHRNLKKAITSLNEIVELSHLNTIAYCAIAIQQIDDAKEKLQKIIVELAEEESKML